MTEPIKATIGNQLLINAPSFFDDPAFVAWLNDDEQTKFTWHKGGTPNEWSDVVLLVDPGLSGEGDEGGNAEFPQAIWDQIVDLCRENFSPDRDGVHITVRISNIR